MDEERLKRIRANIAKHEERKKTQNIMGDIDSSKLDRSNASYNKNDAAFEMAKQHYQNSYVPKKAQEYYKGVENYRNSYEQMANKPSANNYTVMTPENESANLIGDGINTYVSPQMREKAQKHYNEVFNNENKKYAEQYARLNEKSKPAYSYAQAKSEAVKKVDNSINAFSSQFKDENEYNAYADNMARAKEQQRLLNYNVAEARNKLLTMKALNMNPSVKVEDTDEYKRIESDMKKAESVQEFAKNMQNEDFRKQYAEYEQHQKDYENKNWLGKTAEQVGNAIADVLYSIGSGAYGVAESVSGVADSVLGRNPNEGGTLSKNIHDFNNYIHNEAERRQRYSSYAKQGLTTDLYNATNNEEFSDITSNVISITLNSLADAGVSMAMAALTGGTSLTQKGLQSTVGLTKTQKAAQTASSMLKGMTKNLNFWTSFAREGGSAYNDAISAGASNEEATIAMLATGLPNAYIEVGGGVEKFKDLAGTGVKGWLRDFAKSTGEEATEELKQGIISELVKKLTYAPETELFSTADDGSGIINPIRMYQEAFGGAVGGAFGGSVGKAINVASYTVANNMYKSDSMRELIQSGKYTEMLKALPDSDFKNSEISKTFSAEMDEKQTLAKLKGISNRQLIKQYDSMVDTLSSVSEGNVASLALIATGDTKTATEVAPILRKLYDGKAITEEEAKIISRNENVVNMLSETTGLDMTNSSWEDFVTLSEQAQFENITGTSTGNAIADVVLGNAQRAEAGRNYIAEEQNKYANDLSGTPTFTAQIGDESVKITSIDHVENGEVYVNLSNGTTQEAQSLNTDEVTTALLSYASEYDAKTASAFIGGYTGNISVGEYARSFAGVNSAAKAGLSYDNIVKSAPTMINNVGIDTAKTLTKSGNAVALKQATADIENTVSAQQRQATRNDKTSVKNKTGGTVTREHRILARTVSKVTGYTVVLVDSTNVKNGKTVNGRKAIGEFNSTKGEIVLDIGSDDVVATTLHEVTHYIKLNAPTQYNALRDAVIEYATKTGKIEYYLEKYANSYGTDNVYELTEEMTADAAEALLTNEKFISELLSDKSFVNAVVGENKGFVRKFLDTLHDIISSIKDYLKGRTVNHQIARELSEDVKALEKIEKLWRDALTAAVNNHAESSAVKQDTKKSATESGTKFSITEDMSEQERYEELKDKSIVISKDKKLKEVRADRDEKLKALRERYREQQREKRENAAKSELRARITAEYKKLYKDLTSNSKEHHIPEVYKETVANVLANIDLISKASKEKAAKTGEVTKVAEKLNNQLTALENFILNYSMYGNKDDGSSNEQLYNFDPDLISNIKKMKEYFGRYANSGVKAVSDMNTEELEALHNMLKALRYAVRTADKALSANITQRISTLAESSIAEMATDKTRNPFNKNKAAQVVGAVDTYINSQMLDARSYYNGMGNSAFEIYKAFRSGLNSFIKHTHEAQNYFAKVRKDSGYTDKQIKHLVDDYKTYTVSHGEIAMSRAQLMSLYCLSKREQALEHIYKGGIRPTDLKGKRQIKPVMISPDELSSLLKNLNSTEIAMADRLQQFMATTCAEWGNEVSMAMYGYAKFTERNYFPIKSSDTKIRTNDQNSGGDTGLYSVLNYGMTKSLVKNANNSIDVGDIFSVTRQHIEEMSSYSAYAGAVADGMRWFNYNNRETGESVKQSMLNKFGTNGSKYFIELVRDINRNKPTGNYGGEISSVLTSAQKAAAIAGNLSVVVQQPTAIARACTELSLDLITEGIAISATHIKKSVQEAQAHSEIAWWKSQGFFETNMSKSMDEIITGRSTAKDKIVEMAMKPAGLADDVTWGAIWEATKLWTKKYHPEVKVNSEEFYSITKEKFDDVVDQTQVVDSVLHRPMILRSKNALVKMDMSFMAEPLKSANLLRNAIVDVKNKKPNATKRLIRVYASCVMANVLAAAAKAIVMAFRDTGDDEWWEKWFSSFSSDLLSTLNPLSIIPFVKDIFSVLDGYDVERMDMSAVTGIIQFVQQAVEYAQKDNLDKALNLQSAYKLTRYLSQLTGLPVYNVLREIDTIIDIFGDPIFRASQATPATERYEALYNAVMKNDEAEMQNEYDRLGKTQKEIEQRLKSKIIDDSKGNKMFNADVDKAAKARISGDVKTAVEIVRNLADTTALSKDFWTACVNARANKISKAQENRTQLIEAGISKLTVDNMSDTEVNEALKSYETEADTSTASDLNEDTNTESLYTADDLVKALQDGNESDYNTAYDDMVSTKAVSLIMQAEADNKELTADEAEEKAESSIKSAITKVLKPLMRELYKTDKKKFNEMRKKIIKKFGYTSKQITKWLASEE